MWKDKDITEGWGKFRNASFITEEVKETLWLWRSVGAVRCPFCEKGYREAEVLGSD
jgi:hypothetical protein